MKGADPGCNYASLSSKAEQTRAAVYWKDTRHSRQQTTAVQQKSHWETVASCGRERDIFQMFLCISSFRQRAAVSSQLKGRTPTAALFIFSCFPLWVRTWKYYKSPVCHLLHLGELMQLSFKNGSFIISYTVFSCKSPRKEALHKAGDVCFRKKLSPCKKPVVSKDC